MTTRLGVSGMTACLLLALVSSLAGAAFTRQIKEVKVRDFMTERELKETGVWRLSSWEEKALDEWLSRYRERVTKEALGEPYVGEEPEELKGKSKAEICDTEPLPKGWAKTGDTWNPTKCRNTSGIEYNVWIIERYNDKPAGAEMEVCSVTPTPEGWAETSTRWNPTTCGHPSSIINNVKKIKKAK